MVVAAANAGLDTLSSGYRRLVNTSHSNQLSAQRPHSARPTLRHCSSPALPPLMVQPNSTQQAALPSSNAGQGHQQPHKLLAPASTKAAALTVQHPGDTTPGTTPASFSRPAAPKLYIRAGLSAATGAGTQILVQPGSDRAGSQAAARPSITHTLGCPLKAASARRPLTQLHLDAGQVTHASLCSPFCLVFGSN